MTNIFKRRYPGQAIAIIMVILVVATVLGASLYSRTLKNKEAAINTKDSMMAVEQADSLLDLFVRSDFNFLLNLFDEVESSTEGELVYTSIAEIRSFLEGSGVDASILNPNTGISNWCEDTSVGSSLKLTIAPADPITDYVDVRVGSARVFNLEGNLYNPTPCNLNLAFEARESTPTLFTVKKIFGTSDNIEPYVNDGSTDDMLAYCFTPDGNPCPDDLGVAQPSESFIDLGPNNTLEINLSETRGGIPLYMIRIIPLNNTLAVSHTPVECSSKDFSYLKINAAVNCYGSFREKQIMIPGVDSLGYSSLFDYTIYNTGTLEPSN